MITLKIIIDAKSTTCGACRYLESRHTVMFTSFHRCGLFQNVGDRLRPGIRSPIRCEECTRSEGKEDA